MNDANPGAPGLYFCHALLKQVVRWTGQYFQITREQQVVLQLTRRSQRYLQVSTQVGGASPSHNLRSLHMSSPVFACASCAATFKAASGRALTITDRMPQWHDWGSTVQFAESPVAPNGAAKRLPSCALGSATITGTDWPARKLKRGSAFWLITDY
jgi:hypothetical protein